MNQYNENRMVARLAEIVALECGVHSATAKRIHTAAALHDIGKVKIPCHVLDKPDKLTKQEFEIAKNHTRIGAELLSSIQGELGDMSRMICLYHHEHYNGNGYWGKYTDELPAYIPIVSIVDVFVALISNRPYKHAWPPKEAVSYIKNQAGTQFSPVLAKTFVSLIRNDNRVPAIFTGSVIDEHDTTN